MRDRSIDWIFFIIVMVLLLMGAFIFTSAAFGVMARSMEKFNGVVFNQFLFGIGFGICALALATRISYKFWRSYALYILLTGILLSLSVFIPGLGLEHGGAKRWLALGTFSFQPSEILKFGLIIYAAAWFAAVREKISYWQFGLVPLLVFMSIAGGILLAQPDTGTFLVVTSALIAMYVAAGGKWRHILSIFIGGVILITLLAIAKPYVRERITTFMHPTDQHGSAWQIRQSLIAVGSGGLTGRGFGQSVQKFNYLPEPIGDSIYAVLAEELGFIGGGTLLIAYLFFAARGLWLAAHAPDKFGGLVVTGLVILIVSQSMLNISSMLGVTPLTGVPLVFVSHGGSAILLALFEVGVILNISRHQKYL